MTDNNRGPSDIPKPVTPSPTDNSAARKAASAVADREVKKPSSVELVKANVQDKVRQAKQGGTLAFERVRDSGAAASLAVGDAAGAARTKVTEVAKHVIPDLAMRGAAIADSATKLPEKVKPVVAGAVAGGLAIVSVGMPVRHSKMDAAAKGTDADTPAHVHKVQDNKSYVSAAGTTGDDAAKGLPDMKGEGLKSAWELAVEQVELKRKGEEGDAAAEAGIRDNNATPPAADRPRGT